MSEWKPESGLRVPRPGVQLGHLIRSWRGYRKWATSWCLWFGRPDKKYRRIIFGQRANSYESCFCGGHCKFDGPRSDQP
jgi:hypothetical protein